ncbi:M24 family metallopeptidase [Levilinea saccharolytica]|uniref:Peptidase M24 n=1 Tax=Levilinea saccharolytica TaxID=229921 RepID=A0A0N8GQW6_9CHLR|nr:Xaa-Pro peptidase family protein [Levilinea saccharolytica]KPL84842.1 peptidase M24 [Levilinea saccharolytica]GAP18359.1 Xaa-Pro aminopeptidase [Levilinea saccharolytica]
MSLSRYQRLETLIRSAGLDALVLNPGPTLTYLTGLNFHLMERPTVLIIVPGAQPALILPELEAGKLAQSRLALRDFLFPDNPALWPEVFTRAAAQFGLTGAKIGVEPNRLRFMELTYLQNAASRAVFVSAEPILNQLRIQKDAEEIAAMRQAAVIAQNAFHATLPFIHPGVTERAVAAELSIQLLRAGSDSEMPFAPIVAGGPNSANPHAAPSDRPLQLGDLLVIDWGASFGGYCSDLTRTLAIGQLHPELRRIHETVQAANAAGRAAGKPGVPAGDVDRAARQVIDAAGYGPYFTHRTGHGLGMEGHEPPYMFAENDLLLAEGMAYTVEPGIYLPNRGGVRVEDDIVVTADASQSLSDYPRELIILE